MIVRIDPDAIGEAATRLAIQSSAIEHVTLQLRSGAPAALPAAEIGHVSAELDALSRHGHELAARAHSLSVSIGELSQELSSMADSDSALKAALSVILSDAHPEDGQLAGVWEGKPGSSPRAEPMARSEMFVRAVETGLSAAVKAFTNNPASGGVSNWTPELTPSPLVASVTGEALEVDPFVSPSTPPASPAVDAVLSLGANADELIFVGLHNSSTGRSTISCFATDGESLMSLERRGGDWRATAPRPVKSLLWDLADLIGVIEKPGAFERVSIESAELMEAVAPQTADFSSGDRMIVRRASLALSTRGAEADEAAFEDELMFVGPRGSMRGAFQVGGSIVFARVEEELLVGLLGLALGPRKNPPTLPIAEFSTSTEELIISGEPPDVATPSGHAILNNVGLASASWLVGEALAPQWLEALLRPEAVMTLEPAIDAAEAPSVETVRVAVSSDVAALWHLAPEGIIVRIHDTVDLERLAQEWAIEAPGGSSVSLLARGADGLIRGREVSLDDDSKASANAIASLFDGALTDAGLSDDQGHG